MCLHGGWEDEMPERGLALRSAYTEGSNRGLMHVCDLNMTGSSVIDGLLKCSPWRHLTFLCEANSRRMMNQLSEASAPISLHVIQSKFLSGIYSILFVETRKKSNLGN